VSLFLEEVASVLLTPYVLYCQLPACAPAITAFVRDFTTRVEGVGAGAGAARRGAARRPRPHPRPAELRRPLVSARPPTSPRSAHLFILVAASSTFPPKTKPSQQS
jgi:hypothetical protein